MINTLKHSYNQDYDTWLKLFAVFCGAPGLLWIIFFLLLYDPKPCGALDVIRGN